MRTIKIMSIIFTVGFLIAFGFYLAFAFSNDLKLSAFLGAISGIIATIAFGFWISYLFQYENDKRNGKKDEEFINKIRQKEFGMVQFLLSSLVRNFYACEEVLVKRIPGLKASFGKNTIDVENLTINYFVFKEIEQKMEKYISNVDDRKIAKINIDVLYMRDRTWPILVEDVPYDSSRTYEEFLEFNNECVRLYKAMNELNLQYNLKIFTDDEINAVSPFSREIGRGFFINFDPPLEIIKMFEMINKLAEFLNCDFIPAYKKPEWIKTIMNYDAQKKEKENRINAFKEEYTKKAKALLKHNKKGNKK